MFSSSRTFKTDMEKSYLRLLIFFSGNSVKLEVLCLLLKFNFCSFFFPGDTKRVRLTSRTAEPTALAIGLPPNVMKCDAWERVCAIFGVVTTAANGNPLPMPFAIVTEIKCIKIESFLYNLLCSFQDCLCICNLLRRWRIQEAPGTRPPVHFFHFYVAFEEN